MGEPILVSKAAGVCEVRLNRPDKRNAITLAMYGALAEALTDAQSDEAIRVVLLSGEGENFTAGNDLNDFLGSSSLGEGHTAVRFLRSLATFRKVLIAAVHGQTVGIGVTLLLHCDLVVAARSTRLSMPFVKLGLVPEAGSSLLLPRLVGHHRAAELLLLGTALDAHTAQSLGLVNRVSDEAALMDQARELAQAVARQPASALYATKALLRGDGGAVASRIDAELAAFQAQLSSPEARNILQNALGKGRVG